MTNIKGGKIRHNPGGAKILCWVLFHKNYRNSLISDFFLPYQHYMMTNSILFQNNNL